MPDEPLREAAGKADSSGRSEARFTRRIDRTEQAIEFLREDECVEITPEKVRLRKVALSKTDRVRASRRARAAAASA